MHDNDRGIYPGSPPGEGLRRGEGKIDIRRMPAERRSDRADERKHGALNGQAGPEHVWTVAPAAGDGLPPNGRGR